MDKITPSAETANSATPPASDALATSTWGKGLLPYGEHGRKADTDPSLILMLFDPSSFASVPTGIPPPSRLEYGPRSLMVAKATQAIRTSGEPLLLSFLNSAWHLRIAMTNATLPGHWGTEPSGFEAPMTCVVMRAKLFALRHPSPELHANYSAGNVWRVAVPKDSAEEISSFLHTVLREPEQRSRE